MKILIIGNGSIGKRHFANFKKYAEVKVFDKSLNYSEASNFRNIKDSLMWRPDGVVIATPTNTHLKIAEYFLGEKNQILIEKPVCQSFKEARNFLKSKRFNSAKLSVVNNMRFHPALIIIKKNIKKLGKIYFVRSHFGNWLPNMRPNKDYKEIYSASKAKGGGVILDSIHEIDYLSYLFGEIEKIHLYKKKLSKLKIDVEDFTSMIIYHCTGVISELQLDFLRPIKRRGCEIIGENGSLIWESVGKKPENCKVDFCKFGQKKYKTILNDNDLEPNFSYDMLAKEFLKKLKGKKNINILKVEDATKYLEKIETSNLLSN